MPSSALAQLASPTQPTNPNTDHRDARINMGVSLSQQKSINRGNIMPDAGVEVK